MMKTKSIAALSNMIYKWEGNGKEVVLLRGPLIADKGVLHWYWTTQIWLFPILRD